MKTKTLDHDIDKTFVADAENTTYVIDKGVDIASDGQFAIDATSNADGRIFDIAGTLSAATGLGLGNSEKHAVTGSAITLAKTGSVDGSINGIVGFMTGGTITIHGQIDASNIGLGYIGDHGTVTSDGTIQSDSYGVYLVGDDIAFTNAGQTSGMGGVVLFTHAGESATVHNSGTISGTQAAVFGGKGDDTLVNSGTIKGSVQLNDGNDVYHGQGGTVTDMIDGGAGKDKLIGGSASDVLAGGRDNDVLTGNGGRDLFIFRSGDGADTITDFKAKGNDQIELDGFKGIDAFADLSGMIHQHGKDTIIDFGGGDTLTLHDVGHLAKGDFFFE